MVNLFSMSSLIQFVGAFNFANVFAKLENMFMQDFLRVDDMIEGEFGDINEKIQLGIETIPNLKPLRLVDGETNEEAIEKFKNDFDNLIELDYRIRVLVTHATDVKNRMNYASPMFLICGLYTTFVLFIYAMLDMYKEDTSLYASFAIYNVFMAFFIFYFVVCEILKHIYIFDNTRFVKPSIWWCLICFFIVTVSPLVNYLLLEHGVCLFYLDFWWIDFWLWSSIVLSLSGFLVTFIFTLIYYSISKRTVKQVAKRLKAKFTELFNRKKEIDIVYSAFNKATGSKIQFS